MIFRSLSRQGQSKSDTFQPGDEWLKESGSQIVGDAGASIKNINNDPISFQTDRHIDRTARAACFDGILQQIQHRRWICSESSTIRHSVGQFSARCTVMVISEC